MASIVFNTTLQPVLGKRERLTVGATVAKLSASIYIIQPPAGPTKYPKSDRLPTAAMITVEDQPFRYTYEGTDPVATSLGHLASVGDTIVLDSYQKVKNFKATRDGATDAVVEVTYLYGN